MTDRRRFLLIATCVLLTLGVYLALPGPRVPLHFLLIQWCHGVSSGKVIFLLVFVAAVFLRLAWVGARVGGGRAGEAPEGESATGVGPEGERRSGVRVPALLSAAGYGLCLLSQAIYTRKLGLDPTWPSWLWTDGVNSVTTLTHIHTGKAGVAWLVDGLVGAMSGPLGGALDVAGVHRAFDTGWVYLRMAPPPLAAAMGLGFVAVGASWLAVAPRAILRYRRARLAVAAVWALAAATLTKGVADGGPLAYDAAAAALAMTLLGRADSLESLAALCKRRALTLISCVALWLLVIALADPSALAGQAEHFAYRVGLYGCVLALAGLAQADASRRRAAGTLAGVCLAIAGWGFVNSLREVLVPLHAPVMGRVLRYDDGAEAHAVQTPPGASVLQAYRLAGENPYRVRRVSVLRSPGRPTGLVAELVILEARSAQLPQGPEGVVTIRKSGLIAGQHGPRLRLQVEFDGERGPCVWSGREHGASQVEENERFVAYHLLDGVLRRAGFRSYVLIPIAFYRDAPPATPGAEQGNADAPGHGGP